MRMKTPSFPTCVACLLAAIGGVLANGEAAPPEIDPALRERVEALLSTHHPRGDGFLDATVPDLIVLEGREAAPYLSWRLAQELARERREPELRKDSLVPLLIEVLERHGDPASLGALREVLSDDDDARRRAAAHAISRLSGREALDALLGCLKDPSGLVTAEATEALIALAQREDAPDVSRLAIEASRTDPALRRGAMELVARLDAPEAADLVKEYSEDEDESLRILAIQFMPAVDPDRAVGRLLDRMANDVSLSVRKEACQALGNLGSEEAVPPLVDVLESEEDAALAETALWSLRKITGQPFPADPALWRRWMELTGR